MFTSCAQTQTRLLIQWIQAQRFILGEQTSAWSTCPTFSFSPCGFTRIFRTFFSCYEPRHFLFKFFFSTFSNLMSFSLHQTLAVNKHLHTHTDNALTFHHHYLPLHRRSERRNSSHIHRGTAAAVDLVILGRCDGCSNESEDNNVGFYSQRGRGGKTYCSCRMLAFSGGGGCDYRPGRTPPPQPLGDTNNKSTFHPTEGQRGTKVICWSRGSQSIVFLLVMSLHKFGPQKN